MVIQHILSQQRLTEGQVYVLLLQLFFGSYVRNVWFERKKTAFEDLVLYLGGKGERKSKSFSTFLQCKQTEKTRPQTWKQEKLTLTSTVTQKHLPPSKMSLCTREPRVQQRKHTAVFSRLRLTAKAVITKTPKTHVDLAAVHMCAMHFVQEVFKNVGL